MKLLKQQGNNCLAVAIATVAEVPVTQIERELRGQAHRTYNEWIDRSSKEEYLTRIHEVGTKYGIPSLGVEFKNSTPPLDLRGRGIISFRCESLQDGHAVAYRNGMIYDGHLWHPIEAMKYFDTWIDRFGPFNRFTIHRYQPTVVKAAA